MRNLLYIIFLLLIGSSCTTNYYVVRHADRLDNSANSPLSPAGFQRANALRDTLASKGINLVFASTFQRTQQTAQPTATANGLTMNLYSPDTTAGLVTRLRKINGKNILVAGHSDNVPVIVQGLSGQSIPAIASNDFDNLFIIKVSKFFGVTRRLIKTTYGTPSP